MYYNSNNIFQSNDLASKFVYLLSINCIILLLLIEEWKHVVAYLKSVKIKHDMLLCNNVSINSTVSRMKTVFILGFIVLSNCSFFIIHKELLRLKSKLKLSRVILNRKGNYHAILSSVESLRFDKCFNCNNAYHMTKVWLSGIFDII